MFVSDEKLASDKYSEKLVTFVGILEKYHAHDHENAVTNMRQILQEAGHVQFLVFHIEKTYANAASRAQYLNSLKQLCLEACDSNPNNSLKELLVRVDEKIAHDKHLTQTIEQKNRISDPKELKRWRSWKSVLKIRDNLNELVAGHKMTSENYQINQQQLLITMYTEMPPLRLDYGTVALVYDTTQPLCQKNWIDIATGSFHLGHDKVSHRIGGASFLLPSSILASIAALEAKFPGRRFLLTDNDDRTLPLVDENNDPTHKRRLVRLLHNIPEIGTVTVPSHLCVDTLRSSFITDFYQSFGAPTSLERQVLIAHSMRTSVTQLQTSYYKITSE